MNGAQNAHDPQQLRDLHNAVLDIVAIINGPQRDELLIREAGIRLDRALFPLLVLIDRFGPIGIVHLADRVGRDHSTVSRQVGKLASLGLIERQQGQADRRVRRAAITAPGRAMAGRIDAARDRLLGALFESWRARDVATLTRLMRRFADDLQEAPPPEGG